MALHSWSMLKSGNYPHPGEEDGFAARLRHVIDSYGSTSSIARVIDRSEGAVRKWLRGQSEPNVSDLRAICKATGADVKWLVMGDAPTVLQVREPHTPYGSGSSGPGSSGGLQALSTADAPLPPLHYKLMDEVVAAIKLEAKVSGTPVTPNKASSVLTTVYNMSRATRSVDPESAERIVGLML
jgi:transcriptional regulator with XRE-family HTH domain